MRAPIPLRSPVAEWQELHFEAKYIFLRGVTNDECSN